MRALAVARGCRAAGVSMLAIDQHAAGGVGSFAARFAALDDQNRRAFFAERDRERKSDDAAADDDHVPSLHFRIVKDVTFSKPLRGIRLVIRSASSATYNPVKDAVLSPFSVEKAEGPRL